MATMSRDEKNLSGGFSDADGKVDDNEMERAEQWLSAVESNCHSFFDEWSIDRNESNKDAWPSPVKIAILDTGILTDHDDLKSKIGPASHIRDYREWRDGSLLDEGQETDDEVGHGTHCTALLARVAPAKVAHIYVAKVARNTKELWPENVEQALRYATDEWEVDLITMSLGFEHDNKAILDAIEYIRAKKKGGERGSRPLIFAAASNRGNDPRCPIAFPARDENVICVLAIHPGGTEMARFSPTPTSSALCTLGVAVPSAHLPAPDGKQGLSGTSMATPILTGIAAMMLFFVRQESKMATTSELQPGFEYLAEDHLRTKAGMTRLLELVSYPVPGKMFNYVVPFKRLVLHEYRSRIADDIWRLFDAQFRFATFLRHEPRKRIGFANSSPAHNVNDEPKDVKQGLRPVDKPSIELVSGVERQGISTCRTTRPIRSQSEASKQARAPVDKLSNFCPYPYDEGEEQYISRDGLEHDSYSELLGDHSPSSGSDLLEGVANRYALPWFSQDEQIKAWRAGRTPVLVVLGHDQDQLAQALGTSVVYRSNRADVLKYSCRAKETTTLADITNFLLYDQTQKACMSNGLPPPLPTFIAEPLLAEEAMTQLLRSLRVDSRTFIIIDGLHHLEERTIREVLSTFEREVTSRDISIVFLSRPVAPVVEWLRPDSTVAVVPIECDIQRYIRHRLSEFPHFSDDLTGSSEGFSSMVEAILKQAQGVFLVAQAIIGDLSDATTEADLDQRLTLDLSFRSNKTYGNVVQRILRLPDDMRLVVRAAIAWTLNAQRTLNLAELACAIVATRHIERKSWNYVEVTRESRELNIEAVVAASGGLLRKQESPNFKFLGFSHNSIRDYVENNKRWIVPDADVWMAKASVTYLASLPSQSAPCRQAEDLMLRSLHYPLLGYTARFWGVHANALERPDLHTPDWLMPRNDRLHNLLFGSSPRTTKSSLLDALSQIRRADLYGEVHFFDVFPENTTTAHLAGCFGLTSVLKALQDERPETTDFHARDSEGKTPIWYASFYGHKDTVKWLLQRLKIPRQTVSSVDDVQDALAAAYLKSHTELLPLLNEFSGLWSMQDLCSLLGKTPLFLAALQGHVVIIETIRDRVSREELRLDFDQIKAFAAENSNEPAFRAIFREVFRERFQLIV